MFEKTTVQLISDPVIAQYKPSQSTAKAYLSYLETKYSIRKPIACSMESKNRLRAVFDIAMRPLLQHCLEEANADLYSFIDHYLFSAYICPFEDIAWFSESFWNVNHYGLAIAKKLRAESFIGFNVDFGSAPRRIALIHKGPLRLAHAEVLLDFLGGVRTLNSNTEVHLILIDAAPIDICGVKTYSLCRISRTSDKVRAYQELCMRNGYYNIIWVACVQNLSLYMGLQMAAIQTYWTMKRHSIVCPQINRYATFISQYRNKQLNGVTWYGGRYRLRAQPSSKPRAIILQRVGTEINKLISQASVIFGSLARPQKYQSLQYWAGIERLLSKSCSSAFIYGTKGLPKEISNYISTSRLLSSRAINFGWLNGDTADIASLIDIYIDTIPFASGLTAAECVLSRGCYVGTDSDINKEASFINILMDAYRLTSEENTDKEHGLLDLGIAGRFNDAIDMAHKLSKDSAHRKQLHLNQKKALENLDKEGSKHFSRDYLNYFSS